MLGKIFSCRSREPSAGRHTKNISKEVILGLLARANNSPLKRERKAQYHSNFKILNQKSWSNFFYSRQPKREELSTFKDDNGKLWVEVIIVFLDAVAAVDVLTAGNNDVKLVETRTVQIARLESSSRFDRINKLDRDYYSIGKFFHLFASWNDVTLPGFIPSFLKRVKRWRVSWIRSIELPSQLGAGDGHLIGS